MPKRIQVMLLNRKDGESLTFPINPESISNPFENSVSKYNILNYGQTNVIGDRKAQVFTLSNFLPDKYSFLSELSYILDFNNRVNFKPYTQESAKKLLNKWWEKKKVIRLIVGNEINIACRISKYNLDVYERNSDLGYSITLLEYRDPLNDKINQTLQNIYTNNPQLNPHEDKFGLQRLKARVNDRFKPSSVVAQKGESIYKIAKKYGIINVKEFAAKNNLENKLNTDIGGMIIEMVI